MSVLIVISCLVAPICARNDASWMAAVATFALSAISVATMAKRACSACAFSDSTVRRFRPNTSGTNDTPTCGVYRPKYSAPEFGVGATSFDVFWRAAEKPPATLG